MTSVSDDDLRQSVTTLLNGANLHEMTLRRVMTALSEEYGVSVEDMQPRKKSVRTFIKEYLANMEDDEQENGGDTQADGAADDDAAAANDDEGDIEASDADDDGSQKKRKRGRDLSKPMKLTGLQKSVALDEPLADFLGVQVMSRRKIQQALFDYIKEHKLQDPTNGRMILADDALRKVFKVDRFTYFGLSKLVSEHVSRADDCDEDIQQLAAVADQVLLKELEAKRAEDEANGVFTEKKRKKATKEGVNRPRRGATPGTGLQAPQHLSAELQRVCEGETQLSRPQVVKKLWEYIDKHNLKDPNDGRRIRCDDALSAIFDGEREVSGFGMNKYLSAHLTKVEK